MKTIKVNDTITYRLGFGFGDPKKAKIVQMFLTQQPRSKHGVEVEEVTHEQVKENKVLFFFDYNWSYSDQLILD